MLKSLSLSFKMVGFNVKCQHFASLSIKSKWVIVQSLSLSCNVVRLNANLPLLFIKVSPWLLRSLNLVVALHA